jgi:hypothetical protein
LKPAFGGRVPKEQNIGRFENETKQRVSYTATGGVISSKCVLSSIDIIEPIQFLKIVVNVFWFLRLFDEVSTFHCP